MSTYRVDDLQKFAIDVLQKSTLAWDRSKIIADILIESDLMGHTTHGLQLLKAYTDELSAGKMKLSGEPRVISDHGAAITWDGDYLPGPYLLDKAMRIGFERMEEHPVFTLAIQHSHHIACLAAYLERATEKGFLMILTSSDPGNQTVAPFGGVTGVYSPDPLAFGIPTEGDPILFDSSASTVANGIVMQKHGQGEKLGGPWMLDNQGNATDDPQAFFDDPPATILPVGGMDLGFKGYGLALLIEALTSGLAGAGRRNHQSRWTASVQMQLINPEKFAGLAAFKAEMQHLADQCRASTPRAGFDEVRLPGSRAIEKKRKHLEQGVELHPGVITSLKECAEAYGVTMPASLEDVS